MQSKHIGKNRPQFFQLFPGDFFRGLIEPRVAEQQDLSFHKEYLLHINLALSLCLLYQCTMYEAPILPVSLFVLPNSRPLPVLLFPLLYGIGALAKTGRKPAPRKGYIKKSAPKRSPNGFFEGRFLFFLGVAVLFLSYFKYIKDI